jgi:tetratricopeptide (TPR) repeat protein
MKICVYAISKNEEKFVERFCSSAQQADLILIADTGSSDATRELAQTCGAIVHHISIKPWRFDIARNTALALVPSDIDVCISLDLDEVLMAGWRHEIKRVWNSETTRLRYRYQYDDGGIHGPYDKIHARHGYIWHRPCHEFLASDGRISEVYAETNFLMTAHHPDLEKNRTPYLELLEYAVREQPLCPHSAYCYAHELVLGERWAEAIVAYQKFLELTAKSSGFQRSEAMRGLALAYEKCGSLDKTERWYRRATAETPKVRGAWCELAMLMSRQGRWTECYAAATCALSIKDEGWIYEPVMWGHWPHELAAVAAWHMGLKDVALREARAALAKSPTDDTLRKNLQVILSDHISFSFFPDGERARFLDRRMHSQLGDSLAYLCEKLTAAGHGWAESAKSIILDVRNGRAYPPSTFGIYYEIAEALLLDDIDKAAGLFEELKFENAVNDDKLRVFRVGDEQSAANARRYERLMDTGLEENLVTAPVSAELIAAFKIQFERVYSRMKHVVPALANEFDAIIRQLVIVGDESSGFVGGSCYKLWGALFLNANASQDEIRLIEAIAHESAHSLLFGFAVDEPLVLNRPEEVYPSPLRDDLRPMDGVFHATYVSARMHWLLSEFLKSSNLSAKEIENVRAALRARELGFFTGYKTVREFGKITKTGVALLESAHAYMSKSAA